MIDRFLLQSLATWAFRIQNDWCIVLMQMTVYDAQI